MLAKREPPLNPGVDEAMFVLATRLTFTSQETPAALGAAFAKLLDAPGPYRLTSARDLEKFLHGIDIAQSAGLGGGNDQT